MTKKLLFFLYFFCQASLQIAFGQTDDTYIWQEVGFNYSGFKKWDLDATYRFDIKQYGSQFSRSNFTISASRKFLKNFKVGLDYRFFTTYSDDIHRFRIRIQSDYKLNKKLSTSWRTMLQHDIAYIDPDFLKQYKPEWVWRNKFDLEYTINSKSQASIYVEPFISIYKHQSQVYRTRLGVQYEYLFKRRHHFGLTYFYQLKFPLSQAQSVQVFNTSYTFDLLKKKKKKKKK
ncbi:MAG: DUF2490 domain-containing protein [Chitinophagaceae bacterium]